MKPLSKAEAVARSNGFEFRHVYHQGHGEAKSAHRFTWRQISKAMRRRGWWLLLEVLDADMSSGHALKPPDDPVLALHGISCPGDRPVLSRGRI